MMAAAARLALSYIILGESLPFLFSLLGNMC